MLLWRVVMAQGGGGGAPEFTPPSPDLTLPPGAKVEVKLVEVKGPSDTLRDGQAAWLQVLAESGVDCVMCKVVQQQQQQQQKKKQQKVQGKEEGEE